MKTFVFIEKYGWRLVLSSIVELSDYDIEIGMNRIGSSFERVINKKILTKEDEYLQAHCKATGQGFIYGAADVNSKGFQSKWNAINKYGKIYVNEVGGWFMLQDGMRILKTVQTETFKFPDVLYAESDIRITQFNGGKHFYAKVGDFQVVDKDGDTKWNTRQFAETVAKKFLENLNQDKA